MKSFIIILLLCVFGGSKLFAQKTEFIASAPSVVEVGEQFRLSFVLNAKGENLQVPTIKGFDLLAGPSLSTSSNITIINGDMKQNQEYTYTYILEGQEEGEFTIEPATITVDGKEYSEALNEARGSRTKEGDRLDRGFALKQARKIIYNPADPREFYIRGEEYYSRKGALVRFVLFSLLFFLQLYLNVFMY